jgi:hypothetical protein
MLDSGAFPWRVVLALSNVALRFSVDWTGGMEWRDLALGSMNCVYGLVNLTLGQSEFILGIQRLLVLNKPFTLISSAFTNYDSTRLAGSGSLG